MAARMDAAEQRISNIEEKLKEINEAEKKREIKAKEHYLRIREIRGAWVAQSVKRPTSARSRSRGP